MLGEDGDDALGGLARELRAVALALEPAVGHREELAADVLDDAEDEVVAVAEVDVERRPRELGPAHDLVDGQLAERPFAEQRLGGGDDLLLGDLRRSTSPPAGLGARGDVDGHGGSLRAAVDWTPPRPHGVAVSTSAFHAGSRGSTPLGGTPAMGRLGLEPRTTGLTCRTGFHRPPRAPGATACGLDHLFTLGGPVRVGGVWPLRALPRTGLPADRPIPWDFHLARRPGTQGSKGVPANSRRRTDGFPTSAPFPKSLALPIELTALRGGV